VLFGMAGGVIAGGLLGCTRVFNNKYKRLIGICGAGEGRGASELSAYCCRYVMAW
jgi:hypothetical protein